MAGGCLTATTPPKFRDESRAARHSGPGRECRLRNDIVKRRAFQCCASLSLLLALLAGATWVRSHFRHDQVEYTTKAESTYWVTSTTYRAASSHGQLIVARRAGVYRQPGPGEDIGIPNRGFLYLCARPPGSWIKMPTVASQDASFWNRLGMQTRLQLWESEYAVERSVHVVLPFWLLVGVTSVLPATWLVVWHRSRLRLRQGRCTNCGYDLRATPGRCPECGADADPHLIPAVREKQGAAERPPPANATNRP